MAKDLPLPPDPGAKGCTTEIDGINIGDVELDVDASGVAMSRWCLPDCSGVVDLIVCKDDSGGSIEVVGHVIDGETIPGPYGGPLVPCEIACVPEEPEPVPDIQCSFITVEESGWVRGEPCPTCVTRTVITVICVDPATGECTEGKTLEQPWKDCEGEEVPPGDVIAGVCPTCVELDQGPKKEFCTEEHGCADGICVTRKRIDIHCWTIQLEELPTATYYTQWVDHLGNVVDPSTITPGHCPDSIVIRPPCPSKHYRKEVPADSTPYSIADLTGAGPFDQIRDYTISVPCIADENAPPYTVDCDGDEVALYCGPPIPFPDHQQCDFAIPLQVVANPGDTVVVSAVIQPNCNAPEGDA